MLVDVHTRQLFIQPALEVESLSFNAHNKTNVICKEAGFLNSLKNGKGWGEGKKNKILDLQCFKACVSQTNKKIKKKKKVLFFIIIKNCLTRDKNKSSFRIF